MFVLIVAAEIYGIKHNIELGFPERPSLADFIGHCEASFRSEVARVRPHNAPLHRFVIDSVKIFDDTLNRWVDLSSAHQLVEWSQLYLFQPSVDPSNPNEESQAILQPPVRIRSPLEVGKNKEKFFFLFHDMDFNGNGHLNRDEVQRIFNVMGCFDISEKQVDMMFQRFDTNRDGVLSYAEFAKWLTDMPEIGEMLLRKSVEYWQSQRSRRPDIRDSSEVSAQERTAIEQYLDRCRASATVNSASRVRSIKEREDERLLLEREEELRRARDSFRSAYGRELGVPATTLMTMSASRAGATSPSNAGGGAASPVAAASTTRYQSGAGGGGANNSTATAAASGRGANASGSSSNKAAGTSVGFGSSTPRRVTPTATTTTTTSSKARKAA